jgi:hypothetical protein
LTQEGELLARKRLALISAYQTVFQESRLSKDDAADAKKELDKIDATKLSADEQKAFAAAQKAIAEIQKGLNFKPNYETLPGNSKRVFEDVVVSLKTVRQVIGTEVDKKQLVQDTMQALNQVKGDAQ